MCRCSSTHAASVKLINSAQTLRVCVAEPVAVCLPPSPLLQTFTALFQGRAAPHQIKHTWRLLQQVRTIRVDGETAAEQRRRRRSRLSHPRPLSAVSQAVWPLPPCSSCVLLPIIMLSTLPYSRACVAYQQQSESVLSEAAAEFEVACGEVHLQQQLEELEALILQRGLLGSGSGEGSRYAYGSDRCVSCFLRQRAAFVHLHACELVVGSCASLNTAQLVSAQLTAPVSFLRLCTHVCSADVPAAALPAAVEAAARMAAKRAEKQQLMQTLQEVGFVCVVYKCCAVCMWVCGWGAHNHQLADQSEQLPPAAVCSTYCTQTRKRSCSHASRSCRLS